jgi:penicillin-binding protein 2
VAVRPSQVGHLSSHAAGIATSAVQLGVLLSATLNGGIVYQPQVSGPDGFVPHERWRLPAGTVVDGLADGFLSAVNEGSASNAFDPDVIVAGKTGTCSGVGWFASYAPADRPEVVVVVFVQGGSGHVASGRGRPHLSLPLQARRPAARRRRRGPLRACAEKSS